MYFGISKVTAIANEIIYTPIGYVESEEDSIYIDNFQVFSSWYESNLQDIKDEVLIIESWINENTTIYSGTYATEVLPDSLSLIIDLDNPEGVI